MLSAKERKMHVLLESATGRDGSSPRAVSLEVNDLMLHSNKLTGMSSESHFDSSALFILILMAAEDNRSHPCAPY